MTLTGSAGSSSIARHELVDRVAATHPQYASVTVEDAIDDHATAEDGALTRLRVGVFTLRQPGDGVGEKRVARDWVLDALRALDARAGRPVSRREVEQELTNAGLRYSARAVNQGLTALVRDPNAGVTMTVDRRYRLSR